MEIIQLDGLIVHDAARGPQILYSKARPMFIDGGIAANEARKKIMSDYSQETGLEGLCMLAADGFFRFRKPLTLADALSFDRNRVFEWIYWDNERRYSVQEWINQQDGKYLALLLYCCNPLNLDVHSRSSILFVPDNIYSVFLQAGREVKVRMFVPGVGYYNDIQQRHVSVKEIMTYIHEALRNDVKRILRTRS